jgi:signal transduction histidine kinase
VDVVLTDDAAGGSLEYLESVRRALPLVQRYWFDAVIVLASIAVVFDLTFMSGDAQDGPRPAGPIWANAIPLVLMSAVLLFRRRFPFGAPAATFVIGAVTSFVNADLITFTFTTFLTVLAACLLFGMLRDRMQAIAGLALALAAAAIVDVNDPHQGMGDFAGLALGFGVVWLAGFGIGRKLAQAEEAEERVARLEREREERARSAVADERARIARELHDVVGHSVSVMTVQASAVRRLLREDQEKEREALLVVEQTGREALAEMRKLVGVLRRPEEAPALAPQPSLEHLEKLVAHVREAGLPVDLRVEGEAAKLAPGVDLTAYRVVQEGLTNALKHARARRAEVLVRYGTERVELVVTDDGDGDGTGEGGGHGLVGMRERVAVYGGDLDAGPRPGGGYELRAQIPVSGEA